MDEYKEHGLEFRHHDTQISAANRLMLPPLVIGLLVLYGEVDKFLGVEFKNPEAAHLLIWSGCLIISLIWVFNVSRTAQLVHSHLDTRRKNSEIFGLRGHAEIFKMDKNSPAPIVLRHYNIRLIGFWIYISLLLNLIFRFIKFNEVPISLNVILIPAGLSLLAVLILGALSFFIRRLYFNKSPSSSENESNKLKGIDYIILSILAILLTCFLTLLQVQPDSNAYLVRGLEFSAKSEYGNAITSYTKAIKIKPDYAPAYALRGLEHSAKGDDEQSNADWTKAKALRKEQ